MPTHQVLGLERVSIQVVELFGTEAIANVVPAAGDQGHLDVAAAEALLTRRPVGTRSPWRAPKGPAGATSVAPHRVSLGANRPRAIDPGTVSRPKDQACRPRSRAGLRKLTGSFTTRFAGRPATGSRADADFVKVEAGAMEVETMVAERFPVVRSDNHHGIFEKPLAIEPVNELPKLIIEECDAIVKRIPSHREVAVQDTLPTRIAVIKQELVIPWRLGPDPETARVSIRRDVGLVGIEVIQVGEEGAFGLACPQPVEERVVDFAAAA